MPYVNIDQCVNVSQDAVYTYLYMLGGIPFTSIHPGGSAFTRIRNELVNAGMMSKYRRRLIPLGTIVEFDVYTKEAYKSKKRGTEYTFQVRFHVWFPICFNITAKTLAPLFVPIAKYIIDRINYGVHIERGEVDFTLGIHRSYKGQILENRAKWTLLISKISTHVETYRYDFDVAYRWGDLNKSEYPLIFYDMCFLSVLTAKSCKTSIKLEDFYKEVYKEKRGAEPDMSNWHNIRTRCNFGWKFFIPESISLCP